MSNCCSIIYWRDYPSSIELLLKICEELVGNIYVDLFLVSLFYWSMHLSLHFYHTVLIMVLVFFIKTIYKYAGYPLHVFLSLSLSGVFYLFASCCFDCFHYSPQWSVLCFQSKPFSLWHFLNYSSFQIWDNFFSSVFFLLQILWIIIHPLVFFISLLRIFLL